MTLSVKEIRQYRESLTSWYQTNKRRLPWRETVDPYRIWVSEVMLQQTQVSTAIPYYFRFIEAFPDVAGLALADPEQVLKLWEGLGYYARARNFHKAAKIVHEQYNDRIPDDFDRFIRLPGVGDYIASAVQSIAFNHPHAVVDGNVKRVLARILCIDSPVNHSSAHKKFKTVAQNLLRADSPGMFNQAVMELGAIVCTPKSPKCKTCPVAQLCHAQKRGEVTAYPKRIAPRSAPTHQIAVGIISYRGKLLITKRKEDGLLGGLWEFPGGKLGKNETAENACVREIKEETGLDVEITGFLTKVKHAYTHFKIEMNVFYCRKKSGRVRLNGPIDFKWISPKTLNRYAFPGANRKFIPMIESSRLG